MRNELVNEMYASSVVYCMLYLVTIKHGCVCKHLHCMSVQDGLSIIFKNCTGITFIYVFKFIPHLFKVAILSEISCIKRYNHLMQCLYIYALLHVF